MARAVALALRGRGPAAPNPCVGALLVKDGLVLAEGWHRKYGGPHAERECLAQARDRGLDPAGCEMYVTLEPCNHQGKTPPCTEAILAAGIKRVLIGTRDPNPDVAGGGAERLEVGGVEVVRGILERDCLDLIADFKLFKDSARTFNILKMASTLDGRIATRQGKREAVSCAQSFEDVHRLRARVGAVLVGGDTLRRDNPSLTCRLEGRGAGAGQPLAVVVTRRLPAPGEDLNLLRKRPGQTVFWTSLQAAKSDPAQALREIGARVWGLPDENGGLKFCPGFERLRAECGCWHAVCEGGGRLAMSLADQGLVDEFVLYLSPRVLGRDDARPLFSGGRAMSMDQALGFRIGLVEPMGQDLKLTLRPQERPQGL
ncbi:MAG: bifunctional diaminohydroxyphosphoribosylaminopyrimidine deaminase/5-amino-6-(5-phosphoribosylamino)uracil reductase RibD [Desulfovibrionaceae bacterium]|nr:bifunctional diaminohydroxyphosphoribosylaminopyrimidine deaminase/5-amino-6-(5-phosphoribosylamino)uracil reductase RibD [Desulfovibrionaceae bacterium]